MDKTTYDINERLARMAMATGCLDPGTYQLVASGQIPFEACRTLQIPQSESRSADCLLCRGIPDEPQQSQGNAESAIEVIEEM